MFACASLLRRSPVIIDVFDAAPVPFGLVRYGVAPDHQEVKNCINGFDRMFESNRDRLSLFCNVRVGSQITFDELTKLYDGVLLAYGAYKPRKLEIPGINSYNVMSGSDFVSWYNGVPNAKVPLLDSENAVVIGNGNVALDCSRVLSAAGTLRSTDVPADSLSVLENSKTRNIKICGRRGPADISFTIKELREQFKVNGWDTTVKMNVQMERDIRATLPDLDRKKRRLMQVLLDGVKSVSGIRQCQFLFNLVPKEVIPDSQGRVSAVRMLNTLSNQIEELQCGLLIYSLGYETVVLNGVPKDERGMILMADQCRVKMDKSLVYAVGWCAHGPQGVIVDTQQQALFVAEQMARDLSYMRTFEGLGAKCLLDSRKVEYILWDQWKRIDEEEKQRGLEQGKIREKVKYFEGYMKK